MKSVAYKDIETDDPWGWFNILSNVIAVTIVAIIVLLFIQFVKTVFTQEQKGMRLVSLKYENGMVVQNHEVFGAETIRGEWAAKLERKNEILCAGGGISAYRSGHAKMTADIWVGQECPPRQEGDVLIAAWEYKGKNGELITLNGEYVIRPDDLKNE